MPPRCQLWHIIKGKEASLQEGVTLHYPLMSWQREKKVQRGKCGAAGHQTYRRSVKAAPTLPINHRWWLLVQAFGEAEGIRGFVISGQPGLRTTGLNYVFRAGTSWDSLLFSHVRSIPPAVVWAEDEKRMLLTSFSANTQKMPAGSELRLVCHTFRHFR